MISKESIKYSLRNLKQRKTRSAFTIISIFIGITTIFIFISFGLGLYKYIGDLSSASSADKVLIESKGLGGVDPTFSFSEKELKIIEQTSGVYEATGIIIKNAEITQKDVKKYAFLVGMDPKKPLLDSILNMKIYLGRELQPGDRGVVLGYNYLVANKVFSKPYELNQNIEVNGRKLKIIGFYDSVGNPQDDANIYVTTDFIKELFPNETLKYNEIVAKVDLANLNGVVTNIEKNLRKERNQKIGEEDFFVRSFDDLIRSYSTALNIVVGFIILIALISVLVSAVNTANTMITSVLERVKEIGVIKSIGGKNSEVFNIFLFESSFLGFVAGCLGVLIGWILSFIGGQILKSVGYGFLKPYFTPGLFLGCIAFATLTGAISGVIPAIKASKTNPVDALRYE
jgi:putative ABC transport system permease protein